MSLNRQIDQNVNFRCNFFLGWYWPMYVSLYCPNNTSVLTFWNINIMTFWTSEGNFLVFLLFFSFFFFFELTFINYRNKEKIKLLLVVRHFVSFPTLLRHAFIIMQQVFLQHKRVLYLFSEKPLTLMIQADVAAKVLGKIIETARIFVECETIS